MGNVRLLQDADTGTDNGTDRHLHAQVRHVWRIGDGKATSLLQFVDTAWLQDVMGAR
jgi:ketosteroid isomerase-like protein